MIEAKFFLSQSSQLKKAIHKIVVTGMEPVSTLLAPHFKLRPYISPSNDVDLEYMGRVLYASVVGSLMNNIVCRRPHISHVVSRYMHNLGKDHQQAVKYIL